jgi:hypothetical protein
MDLNWTLHLKDVFHQITFDEVMRTLSEVRLYFDKGKQK